MEENTRLARAEGWLDLGNSDVAELKNYIDSKFEDLYERLERTFLTHNLTTAYIPSEDER
jgi:hypothetical protein